MIVAELFALWGVKVDSSWKKVDSILSGLVKKSAMFAAAGAYGLEKLIGHATETAAHLVAASAAMGMTIRQTQEWGYVAEQSGSNLKELSTGVNMFIRHLKEFSQGRGGKALAAQMKEIGMTTQGAAKAFTEPDGIHNALLRTATALKKMDDAKKASMTPLFGARAGKAVIADMARGAEGIIELQKHYRELGAELSQSDALELRGLGNSIKDAKIALNGLVNQSLVFIAPIITDLTDRFIKFINVPENRRAIMENFAGVLRGLAKIAPLVGEGIMMIGHAIAWLGDHTDLIWLVVSAILGLKIAVAGVNIVTDSLKLKTFGWTSLLLIALPLIISHWDDVKEIVYLVVGAFVALKGAALAANAAMMARNLLGLGAGAAAAAGGSAAGAAVNGAAGLTLGAAGAGTAGAAAGAGAGAAGAGTAGAAGSSLTPFAIPLALVAAIGLFGSGSSRADTFTRKPDVDSKGFEHVNVPGGVQIHNNGETVINVHTTADARQTAAETKRAFDEHRANEYRDAKDALGARGKGQK